MTRRYHQTVLFAMLVVCTALMFSIAPTFAAEFDGSEAETEEQDKAAPAERPAETFQYATAQAGYRFVSPDAATAAAEPYSRLKSGMAGGFSAGSLGSDLKLTVEGFALSEDDYHANLFLDYSGYYRLHLESEALWHNLLREQLPPSSLGPPLQYTTRQIDPADGFGVRTSISQMENRIKLGNNPIHINLGYWEFRREGTDQLRFSDHYFATPPDPANTLVSLGRPVDQVTREGKVGIDAHLRYLDIAYTFLIRDFSNEAADTRYNFQVTAGGALNTALGSQATNVISDSRVTSHTIKLYSDMSGGLVGTAFYSLTRRENSVNNGDARPSSQPAATLQSMAGDLSYTPFKELSFALKYRHLQIDNDSPATVFYPYSQIPMVPPTLPGVYTAIPGLLLVRPSVDTVKDTLSLSGTWRPSQEFTYRLEYRAVLESRDNVPSNDPAAVGDPAAVHGENRQTHTGTLFASWKPVPGLKVNTTYTYSSTNKPDWLASSSDSHKGELFLTYAKSGAWGSTASFITTLENNQSTASTDRTVPVPRTYNLPRENRTNSANASVWFSPLERLTITANYSFMNTETDQSVLFANIITNPFPVVATNYHSSAHIYGIDAVYALTERLDLSLAFQQVLSRSRFDVPIRSFTLAGMAGGFNTSGLTDLTQLDTTETGVTARADWHLNKHIGCSLDYSFRKYDSGNPLFDGSVHTTMLLLTSRW
jgi:hypothetical protein